ncbi:MAG: phospholipase D family protein [Actinomycetota bacterium]|nr:phospholipase D family protein [Actinomycetota bacterium]
MRNQSSNVGSHLDDAVGGVLERAVARHHRNRLTKLDHASVLESKAAPELWVPGTREPKRGNAIDVLIDGDAAFAAIADAMASAHSHIHLAGWHLSPEIQLRREEGAPTLRELLAELSERVDVRVLLWAGPPLPAFHPTRAMMKDVQTSLTSGSTVQCVLDARERTLHCHHEKIIVVDDEVAFVGGIDLSDLSGDRWDHPRHPPRRSTGWHDVSTRLRGPVVADVASHFRDRWQEAAHESLAEPEVQPPAGDVAIQLLRTVPEKVYRFAPRGEFSILDGYLRALKSAQHLVYLENQFLWSPEIVAILVDKLRRPPTPGFRMVLVLPARPSSGADTTRGQLGCLVAADNGSGHLLAATVRAHRGTTSGSLYVHAKVGIIDDRWLTIGSANLNEHSLFNDTEVNVLTLDPALARSTRLRLWAEHLEKAGDEIDGDPTTIVDTVWQPLAEEQLVRSRRQLPPTHRLTRLPAVSRRAERLMGPARGLLVDG